MIITYNKGKASVKLYIYRDNSTILIKSSSQITLSCPARETGNINLCIGLRIIFLTAMSVTWWRFTPSIITIVVAPASTSAVTSASSWHLFESHKSITYACIFSTYNLLTNIISQRSK